MNISSNLFEVFLKCPTKCWFRADGEPDSGNDYAEWVKSQAESYRATEIQRLLSEIPQNESSVAPKPANFKTNKWRLAVDVVAQASTPEGFGSVSLPRPTPGGTPGQPADETSALPAQSEQSLLETHLHALERIPSAGRGRPAQFVPIHFIYLRKHNRAVQRFYKSLAMQTYQSEAALKCKQRFEKNRNRLFTFLNFDGIPWNNNNAEHAVKAFAKHRDIVRGSFTPKTIQKHLVLLSVCQTCKYMGVDFLDFLRPGEKNIHAFAESRLRRRRQAGSDYFAADVKSTAASVSGLDPAGS